MELALEMQWIMARALPQAWGRALLHPLMIKQLARALHSHHRACMRMSKGCWVRALFCFAFVYFLSPFLRVTDECTKPSISLNLTPTGGQNVQEGRKVNIPGLASNFAGGSQPTDCAQWTFQQGFQQASWDNQDGDRLR